MRMGRAGAGPHGRKQYVALEGVPVLLRALTAFERVAAVDEIVVVVPEEDVAWVEAEWLAPRRGRQRLVAVAGGASRQESVARGCAALSPSCRWIIVHDGARPLVTPAVIERVLEGARSTGAAVCGLPVTDTIKRVDEAGRVVETLPRESLRAIQTPQAFRRDILERAHAQEDLLAAVTDDAALVERLGVPVIVVEGDPANMKLTVPADLDRARQLLAAAAAPAEAAMPSGAPAAPRPAVPALRIGQGFDVHRLEPGRPLILGGVSIPWEKGLVGHSDADVLAHAITDSILGAAGLGDIGRHFPDTDPAYKGADSLVLLRRAVDMAAQAGWAVAQVDATVIAERPRLAPYIDSMREALAEAMGTSPGAVNVKASTSEGLGFAGRGEGIAALAVALLTGVGP